VSSYDTEKLASIRKIVSFKEVKTVRMNERKQPTATITNSPKTNTKIKIIRNQINNNNSKDSNVKESLLSKQLSLRRTRFVKNNLTKGKEDEKFTSNRINN
jgi:hypothetical protein